LATFRNICPDRSIRMRRFWGLRWRCDRSLTGQPKYFFAHHSRWGASRRAEPCRRCV